MNEKYTTLEELMEQHKWKKYDYDDYSIKKTDNYKDKSELDRIIEDFLKKKPVKTQEEEWQEQLEKMGIAVVEKFLRKKKLERIKSE